MPGRILIARGPETSAQHLADRLRAAFLEVAEEADGRAALAFARRAEPNLIIADARTPILSGLALCRELKRDADLVHVPLLLIAGAATRAERVTALEAGADDLLTPPIEDGAFLARLRALLRAKATVDELRAREETARLLDLPVADPLSESGGFLPALPRTPASDAPTPGNAGTDAQIGASRLRRPPTSASSIPTRSGDPAGATLIDPFPDPFAASLPDPFRDAALASTRDQSLAHPVESAERTLRPSAAAAGLSAQDATPKDAAPGGILLQLSDPGLARRRAAQLRAALNLPVRIAADGAAALAASLSAAPDLVVIEPAPDTPEQRDTALRLISALRARQATRNAGLIAILPAGSPEASLALDLGAGDCVASPPDLAELAARLRLQHRRKIYCDRLREAVRMGLVMAATDPLTGLFNRRYAEAQLVRLMDRCARAERPLSVMMLDLDRFKAINDRHGHAAGDAVLRGFAQRLKAQLRGADLVARLGGEEFCVALPDADEAEARQVAERVRAAVAEAPFQTETGLELAVTVSIGLAVASPFGPPEGAADLFAPASPLPRIEPAPRDRDAARPSPPSASAAAPRRAGPRGAWPTTAQPASPPGLAEAPAPAPTPPSARRLREAPGWIGAPSRRALAQAAPREASRRPPSDRTEGERLMARADAALYRSKTQGRDRVSVAGPEG